MRLPPPSFYGLFIACTPSALIMAAMAAPTTFRIVFQVSLLIFIIRKFLSVLSVLSVCGDIFQTQMTRMTQIF